MEEVSKLVRSILIIDDDRDDYDLVVEAMQEIDPEIKVSFISRCDDVSKHNRNHFDLVLLDINMPHHDGFYWLKGIREHGYSDLPVVMYTNSLSPAHIARAYKEGANLYFSKPETFRNLVRGLDQLLHLDWSQPHLVTERYRQNGHFKTFQPE